jgi:hypothetical protein
VRKAVGDRMDMMVDSTACDFPTRSRSRAFETGSTPRSGLLHGPTRIASLAGSPRADPPTTASEMLGGRQSFRELLEARAASIVMLDLGWCGGLSEGKAIASMAEAFGLPVAPHDCTGPVVWMARVHLSLNAPNALIQETVRAFFTLFGPLIGAAGENER